MNLIEKYTPYTFNDFIHYHQLALMIATSGLILLSLRIVEFIHLLKLCKKAGIKYKDVQNEDVKYKYTNDYYCIDIDITDDEERKRLESRGIEITNEEIEHAKLLKYLKKEVPDARSNISITLCLVSLLMLPILATVITMVENNFSHTQSASVTEIKDYIKIDKDKLTIDNLPDTYEYVNKELKRDQRHNFKIVRDEFYTDDDIPIKLIDKDSNEYKISKSDFEKLKIESR